MQAFKSSTQDAEQLDLWFVGQPGLHNEFQDSQSYGELPCLLKKKGGGTLRESAYL